ncbi:MAG: DUF58 domain-containing protein [Thiohalocapsa sp.]|jgi:uncharacterized protein (DUF58 family)|uniref:DUF58 domain-containing protein n=1 Tax=Thiohalocapsa sp. TaxID=2497641 RepID=UPI0025FFF4F2|nr:DUF58 domain-containing protein [Thiohalocapsa sp.]MCG6943381.1 DUF58 domain-containing protein [Thiohalocapsa sp.]
MTPPIDNPAIRVDADDLIGLRARAERIRLQRAGTARSALAGAHRSRYRGRGMDYRESRHYVHGDDIRNMDWRITARAGDAHVKVFDEERERPVVVLVDFGPSMFFASRGVFKSVQAARLAALIGWSAVGRGDRIGALLFNGGHTELSPRGGRRGQMRLIRALVDAGDPRRLLHAVGSERPHAPGGLSDALVRLRRVSRPGSLVFVLSDFYRLDADSERHLAGLARHSDLLAVQILDALELAPPPPGRYAISDGHRRGLFDAVDRRERARYQSHFTAHQAAVEALTEGHGVPLVRCMTDADPAAILTELSRAQRRMRATAATGQRESAA